jgi:single-strand DNA-binding protein
MFNKITIIGNLGTDPEMRYMPSGDAVTSFSVATNRRYTRNGETVDETEWFRVNAWGRLAETTNQYLQKGKLVYVEGSLRSRPWQTQDGQLRAGNEIRAQEVKFLSGSGQTSGGPGYTGDGPSADDDADDLPW